MNMNESRKVISLKDLILDVMLSCVMLAIALVITPLAQGLGVLWGSVVSIGGASLICGTIYVLMVSKAPHIGTYMMPFLIYAIFATVSGTLMTGVIFVIMGIVAEVVMIGGRGKKWRSYVPYVLFWLCYSFAATLQAIFMYDSLVSTYMGMGMDETTATAAVEAFVTVYCAPSTVLIFAVAAIGCSLVGYFIGTKALHKHFKAAGIA